MDELKFYLITDTHYFEPSLGAYGEAYENRMDTEQKCFAETAAINRAVFRYLEEAKEADIVLIAGDLSFNGEKESHKGMLKLLEGLKASGKKIYVVTAGHDRNENPRAYRDKEIIPVEGTRFDELYDLYHDYGYDEAIAFNREHLSYVAQLCDGVRLLVLCNDSPDGHGLAYTDDLYDWMKEQLDDAKKNNQTVFAMEHYPVIPGKPILRFVGDAYQKDSRRLIDFLADNGVHLIFTGHMHNQSINLETTAKGNKFYDVCTGCTIGCPAFMRLVTLKTDGSEVDIKSIPVPDFEWDKGGRTGEQYLKDQFDRMILTLLTGLRDDPQRTLRKIHADKPALYKPMQKIGKGLDKWTVGGFAKLFFVKAAPEVRDVLFKTAALEIARNVFVGDQPYVEGTPMGDTFLAVFKKLKPLFKILNKKVHGAQGEQMDLYEVLKHSLGNYGVSDYDAVLKLK